MRNGSLDIPARRMMSATVAVLGAAVLLRLAGLAVASVVAGSLDRAVFGWDGALYLEIARHGYPAGQPLAAAANWAFFPVCPAMLAVLLQVPASPTVVMVGWGIVLTAVDVLLLMRLLAPRVGSREAAFVALAWAAAPPNWVYLAAYSEGIFVALELVLLLTMAARRATMTAVLALIIGLARPQGTIWALAAAWWLYRNAGSGARRLLLPLVALAGAALWQVVVSLATGIPLGWFAIEKLPGWEMGFGFAPLTTSVDAIIGLAGGTIDRRLAMIPVVIVVVIAAAGLARRREGIPGRWPSVLVAAQALFVSGGIGGIPRFVASAPVVLLGITGPAVGRRWREIGLVLLLAAASLAFAAYAFLPGGSNP